MPRKILPHIAEVRPGERPLTLRIRRDKGEESLIDVSGMIQSFRVYAPLRQSAELFRQVKVGEYGTDVVWTDEIDMAADTLRRLAQEQADETMTMPFGIGASAKPIRWTRRRAHSASAGARSPITKRAIARSRVSLPWRPEPWIQLLREDRVGEIGSESLGPGACRGCQIQTSFSAVRSPPA
jgi:hypothetical protein